MNNEPNILYTDYGFIYNNKNAERLYTWADITKIIAYKTDLLTMDEVRMEIWDNKGYITINEEQNLWKDFMIKISQQYPEIDKEWFSKVVKYPFDRNETILYQKLIKQN